MTVRPIHERIAARLLVTEGGCWEWQGSRHPFGYGRLNVSRAVGVKNTHRLVWELVVGPIPEGMHLDHLCRNPPCCNPAHLELVTPRENALRSHSPTVLVHLSGQCAKGHPRTPENSYARKDRPGRFNCNACRRERRAQGRTA